jgi:3-oxoacyl-[acyl-carrier-protein] synthase III
MNTSEQPTKVKTAPTTNIETLPTAFPTQPTQLSPFYLHHSCHHMNQSPIPLTAPELGLTKHDAAIYEKFFGYKKIAYSQNKRIDSMLIRALQKLLECSQHQAHEIDLLIHAHTHQILSPLEKPQLHEIKKQYKTLKCPCFGISLNNCASFLSAIDIAQSMLCNENTSKHCVILTGDLVFTQQQRQIPRTAIMGECATACWLSNQASQHRLINIRYQTHGRYAKGSLMNTDDRKHFEAHYLDYLYAIIDQTLSAAHLSLADIKLIIPHNVNKRSWHRFSQRFTVPMDSIFLDNIAQYGHCYNADLCLNWASIDFNQTLEPGDYYIMVTVGLGAIFAAALWQYLDKP